MPGLEMKQFRSIGIANLLRNQIQFNSNKAPVTKEKKQRRVVHHQTFNQRLQGIDSASSEQVSCDDDDDDSTPLNDTEKCHKYLNELQKFQQDEFTSTRNRTFQRENVLRILDRN